MVSTDVMLDGLPYGFLGESLVGLDVDVNHSDRQILRELASRVAELAADPSQAKKRDF